MSADGINATGVSSQTTDAIAVSSEPRTISRAVQLGIPIAIALGAVLLWEILIRAGDVPEYIVPAPSVVARTLVADWATLGPALWITLRITFASLALAIVAGVGLALLFSLSRWVEISLFPFAVVLQVTPIVAIAPLILIYAPSTGVALLICAWIVAFFPILSNTVVGLRSADRNLQDLFTLYRATRWQRLTQLLVPSALPYFLASLKIAGGLSLIGAVVAEFAAGTSGQESGLAYRILESAFRLNMPRMFAALLLISACGVVIFFAFGWLARAVLGKWHESEMRAEH